MEIPLRRTDDAVWKESIRADVGLLLFYSFDLLFFGLAWQTMHFLVQLVSSVQDAEWCMGRLPLASQMSTRMNLFGNDVVVNSGSGGLEEWLTW